MPPELSDLYSALGYSPARSVRRVPSDFSLGEIGSFAPSSKTGVWIVGGLALAFVLLRSRPAGALTVTGAPTDGPTGPATIPTGSWPDYGIIFYTVKAGDSLSEISLAQYGTYGYWPLVYDANRATIGANPDVLRVGQQLMLPKPEAFTAGHAPGFTPADLACAQRRVAAHQAAWAAMGPGTMPTLGPDVLTPC